MTEKLLPVVEVFGPTIQGEGACAGLRSHFVRFGYCDGLRSGHCTWCDSMHAVDPKLSKTWERLTQEQILERVLNLEGPCRTVTLSGGNPCLYDLEWLARQLVEGREGGQLWVETQGTVYRAWLQWANVTISPKPPSAGEMDWERFRNFVLMRIDQYELAQTGMRTCIKVPVDPGYENGDDLEFARQVFNWCRDAHIDFWAELYLSIVTYPNDTREDVLMRWSEVVEWLKTADMPDVHCLPQLHVLLWGHEKGV